MASRQGSFHIEDGRIIFGGAPLKKVSAAQFRVLQEVVLPGHGPVGAYLEDAAAVWWFAYARRSEKLLSRDRGNFRILDAHFAVDASTVYADQVPIPGSHPASFEVFTDSPYFARDRHQAYAHGGPGELWIIDGADAGTFFPLGWNAYATDRDRLFHYFHGVSYAQEAPTSTQRELLRAQRPAVEGWWHDDGRRLRVGLRPVEGRYLASERAVFFETRNGQHLELLRGADPRDLRLLEGDYAVSGDLVFWRWTPVHGADARTFASMGFGLARDAAHVYNKGLRGAVAHVDSFRVIPQERNMPWFARDRERLYAFRMPDPQPSWRLGRPRAPSVQVIEEGDPDSLVILSSRWAMDASQVYRCGVPKPGVDRASFRHVHENLNGDWAADARHVYDANGDRILKGFDGATFRRLDAHWACDAAQVFSFDTARTVRAADAGSFAVLGPGRAFDRSNTYEVADEGIRKRRREDAAPPARGRG